MSDFIYMDNAATTALDPLVLEAMMPYLTADYANASGSYKPASLARSAVNKARAAIAAFIGAEPDEIFFTSGGTESDNMALRGTVSAYGTKDRRFPLITDSIEHPAVSETVKNLEKEGLADVKRIMPDNEGFIQVQELKSLLKNRQVKDGVSQNVCGLLSIMHANNEIGSINDIAGLSAEAHAAGYLVHTDAVQTLGHIPVDVNSLGADLLSASAHKLAGPKGVGLLYVRRGTRINCLFGGGGQEKGLRSGTYNTAGIVGFGKAVELAAVRMQEDAAYVQKLREKLVAGIMAAIPGTIITGPVSGTDGARLPGNASFAFRNVRGSSLVIGLDMKGICASTGSACAAGSLSPSHVLEVLRIPSDYINGSLRLTLSRNNTEEEVDKVIAAVTDEVRKLRDIFGAE